MSEAFQAIDYVVLICYIVGVTAFGVLLGRRQTNARDYFLADRSIPWWAICASVVATETSALTFISVPATSYGSDLWMLQLTIGYLIGRLVIAAVLLPAYFRGELTTAYALLGDRFGDGARRFASVTFMVTRTFADSVRLFATAIPIQLITGLPYWQAIAITGALTVLYTYWGGLRAVIWVDVAQLGLYIFGGVAALIVLLQVVPDGWSGIVAAAEPAAKLRIVHLEGGFASVRWLFTGLIGGAFLSMASHGVDHIIVQRLLAARSLGDARRALITSGFVVIAQFALFLLVGVGLYAFYQGRAFGVSDEVFPRFILEQLPPGVTGLVIAGILAAAMSTVGSSLNSLASAATHDIYVPVTGRSDPEHLMRVGRRFTLLWAAILIGGAMLFQLVQQGTPVVVIALQIASFTYGGLLGGFMLGIMGRKARQADVILGMSVAMILMTVLWAAQQWNLMPRLVDTLWFSLLGAIVTVVVGSLSARRRVGVA